MTFQIVKLATLNNDQQQAAVTVFVEGFYNIFSKSVSKDKQLLQKIFSEAIDPEMVYVCLDQDQVAGVLGLATIEKRVLTLNKDIFQQLLGKFNGWLIYQQMHGMVEEITVTSPKEAYVDYLTTAESHRGRGIASHLLKHLWQNLPYNSYSLEVLSKNTNAKRLYESLGFTTVSINKSWLIRLAGLGEPILMRRSQESHKK